MKLGDIVPPRIGRWSHGDKQSVIVARADDAFPAAGSDQLVARSYRSADAPTVMLLIAYGSTQGATLQLHRPETCYPGQGFRLSDFSEPALALGGGRIQARRFTATRDQRVERLIYWTRIANSFPRNTAGEYAAILGSVVSGMVPDGVLVRLSTLTPDIAQADAALDRFAAELVRSVSPLGRRVLLGAAIAGEIGETAEARRG
jgi:EpsI family protein